MAGPAHSRGYAQRGRPLVRSAPELESRPRGPHHRSEGLPPPSRPAQGPAVSRAPRSSATEGRMRDPRPYTSPGALPCSRRSPRLQPPAHRHRTGLLRPSRLSARIARTGDTHGYVAGPIPPLASRAWRRALPRAPGPWRLRQETASQVPVGLPTAGEVWSSWVLPGDAPRPHSLPWPGFPPSFRVLPHRPPRLLSLQTSRRQMRRAIGQPGAGTCRDAESSGGASHRHDFSSAFQASPPGLGASTRSSG